jgi:uncharacterized membrane protein
MKTETNAEAGRGERQPGSASRRDPATTARGLGWFSIGLGAAELLLPGGMARFIGVCDDRANRNALRAFGVREIATGAGLLARPTSPTFAWLRVAGDAMDLVTLAGALVAGADHPGRVLRTMASVAGVTALDVRTAQALQRGEGTDAGSGGKQVARAITIGRPAQEVYQLWRNFENLPRFMTHLESVKTTGDRTSHWAMKTLGGVSIEWDAEITEDVPGKCIAWRSLPGADVKSSGQVDFKAATRQRGTEVCVTIDYQPPGGKLGAALASLFGEEPGQLADHALRQLKQIIELGEIVRSDASIHKGLHPARPAGKDESPRPATRVRARAVETPASASPSPSAAAVETPPPSVQPAPGVPR